MKKLLYIVIALTILASCKSKKVINDSSSSPKKDEVKTAEKPIDVKSRFVKMSFKEVNSQKVTRAYHLGKRLLETCNTSKFKPFTKEEATEKVIQNATVEKLSKACQKILFKNGKFIDIELIDIMNDTETNDLVFRYKIDYEKKYFQRELYITINSEGKVAGMKTKELPRKPL
ncbi:hypothetical protein [Flavobacterium sp.]|uniref:hypothetical protein n=1 Tax=Flavobacterium sp. TaxID=239 RepID=UPI00260392AD|nr:hypothetical protein [Flavobacterium sp.]